MSEQGIEKEVQYLALCDLFDLYEEAGGPPMFFTNDSFEADINNFYSDIAKQMNLSIADPLKRLIFVMIVKRVNLIIFIARERVEELDLINGDEVQCVVEYLIQYSLDPLVTEWRHVLHVEKTLLEASFKQMFEISARICLGGGEAEISSL